MKFRMIKDLFSETINEFKKTIKTFKRMFDVLRKEKRISESKNSKGE